jgi:TatD DNase family protein
MLPEIIAANRSRFTNGVVHSFTGEMDEMLKLVELGLYIGA